MPLYSVKIIMAQREKFTDPLYSGFNLDEVLKKNRQNQGLKELTRGENAWKATMAATAEEGTARIIKRELNKISPEKYDILLPIFLDEQFYNGKILHVVVDGLFQKALQEPGYSEVYAKLCFDMAKHDSNRNKKSSSFAAITGSDKPFSQFSKELLGRVLKEFNETHGITNVKDIEEREELEACLVRRKKANIKFMGQLFLKSMLSFDKCVDILKSILHYHKPAIVTPESLDLEVLCELLECTGAKFDNDCTKFLDPVCARLKILQDHKNKQGEFWYPSRLRFRIMDLLAMRTKGWQKRVMRVDAQSPTTLKEQQILQNERDSKTFRFPATSKNRNSKPSFPYAPSNAQKNCESPTGRTSVLWKNLKAPARDTNSAESSPSVVVGRSQPSFTVATVEAPVDKFHCLVRNMMQQWWADNSDGMIPNWESKLNFSDFSNEDEARQEIVSYVVHDACTVTDKDAQQRANIFLLHALALDDDTLFRGMGKVLGNAIEEGLQEDAPLFNERFYVIAELMAGPTPDELYINISRMLAFAYDAIKLVEDPMEVVENLLDIWNRLPIPEITFEMPTIKDIIDSNASDLLTAHLIKVLIDRGFTNMDVIQEWMAESGVTEKYAGVIEEMKHLSLV